MLGLDQKQLVRSKKLEKCLGQKWNLKKCSESKVELQKILGI